MPKISFLCCLEVCVSGGGVVGFGGFHLINCPHRFIYILLPWEPVLLNFGFGSFVNLRLIDLFQQLSIRYTYLSILTITGNWDRIANTEHNVKSFKYRNDRWRPPNPKMSGVLSSKKIHSIVKKSRVILKKRLLNMKITSM